MQNLRLHIENRNSSLTNELKPLKNDLQNCFTKNILKAGVLQPGYFSDFYPILNGYVSSNIIEKYIVTEEEYTEGSNFYKIPIIDVTLDNKINYRIFLSPF